MVMLTEAVVPVGSERWITLTPLTKVAVESRSSL